MIDWFKSFIDDNDDDTDDEYKNADNVGVSASGFTSGKDFDNVDEFNNNSFNRNR